MKKILVSGASGIVGYGILRSLRRSATALQLIGTTIYDDSAAEAFCDIFVKAPLTSDPAYLDWLIDTIEKNKVDLLIPGIDADLYVWAANLERLEKTGAKIVMNNTQLVLLCKDKWNFFEYLKNKGSEFVIPSSLSDDFDELEKKFALPLLLKPRQGFGSKGIVVINDSETFSKYKNEIGSVLIVQPLMGNEEEEYTTSAFADGQGGFYACMTLKRKLSKDGFTEKAEVISPVGIEEAIEQLCRIFKPIGPTNFQFRLHEGKLKLLEINPRVSSSTSIRSAFGYNESLMAVEYFLENKIPVQPVIKPGKAVRYIEDHIFYK